MTFRDLARVTRMVTGTTTLRLDSHMALAIPKSKSADPAARAVICPKFSLLMIAWVIPPEKRSAASHSGNN